MGCPVCGSEDITRSHRRSFEKLIKYIYPKRPYRCKECWARFWVWENPFKTWKQIVITVLVACIVIFVFCLPFLLPAKKSKVKNVKGFREKPSYHKIPKKNIDKVNITKKPEEPRNISQSYQKPGLNLSEALQNQTPPVTAKPKKMPESVGVKPLSLPDKKISGQVTKPADLGAPPEDSMSPANQLANPQDKKPETDNKIIAGNILKDISKPETILNASEPKKITQVKDEKTPEVVEPSKPEEKPGKDKSKLRKKSDTIPLKSPIAVKPEKNAIGKVQIIKWPEGFKMAIITAHPVAEYNHFFLDGPPKLVLDIKGKWKLNTGSVFKADNNLVKQVRIGEHDEFIRVVFDLKTKKPLLPEFIKSGNGLIVTLKQK